MKYKEITSDEYEMLTDRTGRYKITNEFGGKSWYQDNKLHRKNGPAIIYDNGTRLWIMEDEFNREDGPAVMWPSGGKVWYLKGIEYSKEEWFSKLTKEQLTVALANPDNF